VVDGGLGNLITLAYFTRMIDPESTYPVYQVDDLREDRGEDSSDQKC
jgi:hypothetical protein